jgi:hypothetical protein
MLTGISGINCKQRLTEPPIPAENKEKRYGDSYVDFLKASSVSLSNN